MAIIQSPFPPLPSIEYQNVHTYMFGETGRAETDYTLHIDGITGRKVSRNEFVARVRDGATALSAPTSAGGLDIGASSGEIIGVFSHNALDYATLVHSLLVLTTPFALLSAYATPFELAHSLRTSQATYLFVQPELLPTALLAAREVRMPLEHIYVLGGEAEGRGSFGQAIDEVRRRGTQRAPVRPAEKDTLAYLVFSSGTTGLPKAVMISHGNICVSLAQNDIVRASDQRPPLGIVPVGLAFLPMYHTYGLHMFCFRGFAAPATFVILPRWDLDLVLKIVPKYRIHILYLIPSALHQMVQYAKRIQKSDFASVMAVVCGAAYLPPKLEERFKRLVKDSLDVTGGYGMSEVTVSASRIPSHTLLGGRIPPAPGCVGILLSGMEARIVREDGTDAATGEQGELWLRGENVALGYWRNEKATRETYVEGGWLRTGDQMRADALGRLFFVDRAKDTLKVSGLQVSPTEIEELLMAHPEKLLVDACVAGVSGGRTSDEKVPCAWVVLSEEGQRKGAQAVVQELDAWTKGNLSKYKWLRGGIEVVDEIPKSPTGKVLRRTLQDRYEERAKARAKL
ncbi:amp dependent CoA ligase [Wolfiporia cocos MD-104 SS10]|uniref:Amp dependent CoA ligase n=1 Tax=Wolfiporia cocos (strain MD-104) TaxID=742152 RepID=A0A2H3JE36_WOLCO|nr:amp dependent CoA ligase [Wolfiporia cocos MD-104 SS10]